MVQPGSPLEGKTVGASSSAGRHGGSSWRVAIKHSDGRLAFDPADDDAVAAGDILITVRCRQLLGGRCVAFSR